MVPAMAYELFKRNVRPLVSIICFAFGGIIDRNQLRHSENSAKCIKPSQRVSLSFT